jgi:hypothetical protein
MVVQIKTKPFQNIHTKNNQTTSEHSYSMTFQHVVQAFEFELVAHQQSNSIIQQTGIESTTKPLKGHKGWWFLIFLIGLNN